MNPQNIGRYEVVDRIGRGGMGALYLARDPNIDRLVAIKVLHSDLDEPELRARFTREARAAGALAHPHIVTVFDYGEHDGSPFLVMEYIRGETLAKAIARRAPEPLTTRAQWVRDLCAGLACAHEAGVVHRDVKPANLMIDRSGVLKILDFGVARITASDMTSRTLLVGTPGYISPEQIEGKPVDPRCDLFAAGAVAYELFSYQRAFAGETQHTILLQVLHQDPPPLTEVCPGIDADLAAIVARALQKDPANRYQSAVDMQRDVERVLATHPLVGTMPQVSVEERVDFDETIAQLPRAQADVPTRPIPSEVPPLVDVPAAPRDRGRRRGLALVAAAAFAILAVWGAAAWNAASNAATVPPDVPAAPPKVEALPPPPPPPPAATQAEDRSAPDVAKSAPGARDLQRQKVPLVQPTAAELPPPPPPPPPVPVRVGGNIAPPTRVKNVAPVYPAIAQSARVQGVVIVEATIARDGKVSAVKVLRSIPLLDDAALEAVKQWEYTPTLLNGVAVPVIMTVTVNFALQDDSR
jgi:serine/threonine-protein kinase